MLKQAQVGDSCCADPIGEGDMLYGVITRIEDGLAWSNLASNFCGDVPTESLDGVWVFTAF